jgi:membrane-anchored glycerophosphoryl diester phosphodiesterase (GDPDase)
MAYPHAIECNLRPQDLKMWGRKEIGTMDFKMHLEKAWDITLKNLVNLILMTLVMMVVSIVTLGLLAPVLMAGYLQTIVHLVRDGREPRMEDLFSQMRLFLPLLLFCVIVGVVILIGFALIVLPGFLVVLAMAFGCIYMLPLMTDKQMKLVDALKASWQIALKENVADHIVVVILFFGLIAIGSSVFIGSLFTQPFASVFLISIYLERTQSLDRPQSPPSPPAE